MTYNFKHEHTQIKKSILNSMKPNQYNPNVNLGQPQINQPPATSPEEQNLSRHFGINEKSMSFLLL